MSQKTYQITEVGEKMIVDAFEETAKHGYPPPNYPEGGEAEEGLRVLCAHIVVGSGIEFGRIANDAGLNKLERGNVLLSFAAIILAFRLHDMELVEAVSSHFTKTGLAARIEPHLDMSGIDQEIVERQMQEAMANPEPEPLTEIIIECCDNHPEAGAECCEDNEQ